MKNKTNYLTINHWTSSQCLLYRQLKFSEKYNEHPFCDILNLLFAGGSKWPNEFYPPKTKAGNTLEVSLHQPTTTRSSLQISLNLSSLHSLNQIGGQCTKAERLVGLHQQPLWPPVEVRSIYRGCPMEQIILH